MGVEFDGRIEGSTFRKRHLLNKLLAIRHAREEKCNGKIFKEMVYKINKGETKIMTIISIRHINLNI